MSKIFVPNVIISTKYDHFLPFISSEKSKSFSFENIKEDENTLVISPANNRYLNSFEYGIGMPEQKTAKLVLKLIDTDNYIQSKFLSNSVITDMLAHQLEESIRKKEYFGNDPDYYNDRINTDLKIYFAFGIGNDLNNWAGPYIATLFNSTLDISKGVREVTLEFFPTTSYLFRKRLDGDKHDPQPYEQFNAGGANIKTIGIYHFDVGKVKNGEEITSIASDIIKNVYSNYLKQICKTNNIIFLFPSLESTEGGNISDYFHLKAKQWKDSHPFKNTFRWASTLRFDMFAKVMRELGIKIKEDNSEENKATREYVVETLKNPKIGFTDIKNEQLQSEQTKDGNGVAIVDCQSSDEGNNANAANKDDTNIPNWWRPLQTFEEGLQKIIPGLAGSITCFQENDLQWISLWNKQGLIPNANEPCTIIGVDQMIYDHLYQNQGGQTVETKDKYKSKYKFNSTDKKIEQVLTSDAYKQAAIKLNYKNKNNSSFNEKLITDELSFSEQSNEYNIMANAIELTKKTDIPLFTYNLFNSNVLDVNVEINQNYFNAMNFAVREDRHKKFGHIILEKNNQIKDIIDPDGQVSLALQEVDKRMGPGSKEKLDTREIELIKDDKLPDPQLIKLKPYLTKLNEQGITYRQIAYLNVLIDLKNNGKLSKVNPDALVSVAQFLERRNEALTLNSGNFAIPKDRGASKDTVMGEIFDYMYKSFLSIQLRTLPFFHLSGWNLLQRPAIILAKRVNIINPLNSNWSRDNLFEFYNGIYTITGFKHVINTKEAYSEFKLIKNQISLDDSTTLNNKSYNLNEQQIKDFEENGNTRKVISDRLKGKLGIKSPDELALENEQKKKTSDRPKSKSSKTPTFGKPSGYDRLSEGDKKLWDSLSAEEQDEIISQTPYLTYDSFYAYRNAKIKKSNEDNDKIEKNPARIDRPLGYDKLTEINKQGWDFINPDHKQRILSEKHRSTFDGNINGNYFRFIYDGKTKSLYNSEVDIPQPPPPSPPPPNPAMGTGSSSRATP